MKCHISEIDKYSKRKKEKDDKIISGRVDAYATFSIEHAHSTSGINVKDSISFLNLV